jgi:hypothetical protein
LVQERLIFVDVHITRECSPPILKGVKTLGVTGFFFAKYFVFATLPEYFRGF